MKKKSKAIEIIASKKIQLKIDRLYWLSDSEPPKNISESFYFNIDNVKMRIIQDLQYDSFYQDFGPLNIGKTYRYVT